MVTTHLEMVDAILHGEGLDRVAEIAMREVGSPVTISLPRLGLRGGEAPGGKPFVTVPILSGDEQVGTVAAFGDADEEVLQLAAVASLTEVALLQAREDVEDRLRGSVLEELRAGRVDDVERRARRLGCDLTEGAFALVCAPSGERPRQLASLITASHPGALAEPLDDGRVWALLPAAAGDTRPRLLAERLAAHGSVGVSGHYGDVGELPRALDEAELVLAVRRRGTAEDLGTATYRLLFRVLASRPEEVRAFYEDTLAPVVRYDEQYASDLVGTLAAWFAHDCNMAATAAAIHAHRHTVAYRLERIKELSGLDPAVSEDRERLGLGLKAHKVLEPGMHK